jgi:hypothetical protein
MAARESPILPSFLRASLVVLFRGSVCGGHKDDKVGIRPLQIRVLLSLCGCFSVPIPAVGNQNSASKKQGMEYAERVKI